jgi:hypothetical protein
VPAANTPRLDDWIAKPAVRTRHRRSAAVEPEALWEAARSVRLDEAHALGRVVRWRIPGVEPDQTFDAMFRRYPFALLAEGETWSLSGLCGRIWTLQRDYPELAGAEGFRSWHEPGTVRVLFAHWVVPADGGRAVLHSEARVQPVDRRAAVRLRALWTLIGGFERLVGAEALTIAAQRAEDGRPRRRRAPR